MLYRGTLSVVAVSTVTWDGLRVLPIHRVVTLFLAKWTLEHWVQAGCATVVNEGHIQAMFWLHTGILLVRSAALICRVAQSSELAPLERGTMDQSMDLLCTVTGPQKSCVPVPESILGPWGAECSCVLPWPFCATALCDQRECQEGSSTLLLARAARTEIKMAKKGGAVSTYVGIPEVPIWLVLLYCEIWQICWKIV